MGALSNISHEDHDFLCQIVERQVKLLEKVLYLKKELQSSYTENEDGVFSIKSKILSSELEKVEAQIEALKMCERTLFPELRSKR